MGVEWKDVVKQVSKENPGLKLSEVLKLASPIYKKQKGNSSGVISTTSSSKSRKSIKRSSSGSKSRKSKRRGRKSKRNSSNVIIV